MMAGGERQVIDEVRSLAYYYFVSFFHAMILFFDPFIHFIDRSFTKYKN